MRTFLSIPLFELRSVEVLVQASRSIVTCPVLPATGVVQWPPPWHFCCTAVVVWKEAGSDPVFGVRSQADFGSGKPMVPFDSECINHTDV
ncbi:unnamed protein product [Haemonchus placei]|uniref:Secreted protein n=1 Tax=Haemonchus placei TaxID=6290 RepID=A0A0N4X0K4_HAEPC|nr:unnamed protein product [Haemonchus placei]